MKENILTILIGILFLAFGIMGLFFPKKLQRDAIKDFKRHKTAELLNPFSEYIKSPSFIQGQRFCGLIGIAGALLLLYALLKRNGYI
jgi:hypothetical protein